MKCGALQDSIEDLYYICILIIHHKYNAGFRCCDINLVSNDMHLFLCNRRSPTLINNANIILNKQLTRFKAKL